MAQTIQIKRSTSSAAPGSNLAAGELAYSSNSDKLFIGHPDGSTGNIVIGSTVPFKVGGDTNADVNVNILDLLDITGDTGITTTVNKSGTTVTLSVDLDDTTVTAGSYGSATAIPTFTVDAQGRLTAAGTASISTSLTIQSDDAADNTVALATDTLKLLGGTGITTSNSGDDVTIAITDAELVALAGLTSAADKLPYFTGSGTASLADFSAFGRSLVDDANAAAARTTLDVDQAGTDNSTDVTLVTTTADYLSISGQAITLGLIDLTADVTGALPNANLANSSITVGSTSISLGGTAASLDGLNTLHGIDGSGTDVAGTNLTIQAGAGTGAGAGGSILFQTADGTTSGSGVNSFTTAMTIADDGAVTIAGNLTVNGTTTTVNSNTVDIGDNIILLNSDETGTPSQNAGLEVERGTATNVYLRWNETTDLWQVSDNAGTAEDILTDANFETQITTIDGGTF